MEHEDSFPRGALCFSSHEIFFFCHTRMKIQVLEGLRLLVIRLDVKSRFPIKILAVVHFYVQAYKFWVWFQQRIALNACTRVPFHSSENLKNEKWKFHFSWKLKITLATHLSKLIFHHNIASKFVQSNSIAWACFIFLLCTLMTSANKSLEKKKIFSAIFLLWDFTIKKLVKSSAAF